MGKQKEKCTEAKDEMKLQRKTSKKGGSRIHEKQIKVQKVPNQIHEKKKVSGFSWFVCGVRCARV